MYIRAHITGVACTDIPARSIASNPAGFECDACPLGLVGDGQDCQGTDNIAGLPSFCVHVDLVLKKTSLFE